jgi:hypothetical protein
MAEDVEQVSRRSRHVWQHEERAVGFARKLLDHAFHLGRVVNRCSKRLYRQQRRSGLDCPRIQERRCVWVKEICDSRDVWSDPFNNSNHLLAIEGSKFVKPVRLPPGRSKLWTTAAVTGSLTWTNTVGVVAGGATPGSSA